MSFTYLVSRTLGGQAFEIRPPDFGDSRQNMTELEQNRIWNGDARYYPKKSDQLRRTHTWTSVGREKILEVMNFMENYGHERLLVNDHTGLTMFGWVENIPFEVTMVGRSNDCGGGPSGRDETGSFSIVFIQEP